MCFFFFFWLHVRAWEQGRVIVCNGAKLPLIRRIEKEACAPEGNQPSVPPLLKPGPSALKSVPDEGFPVGIRCSCSIAKQTRTKKRKAIDTVINLTSFSWVSETNSALYLGPPLKWTLDVDRKAGWHSVKVLGQFNSSQLHPPSAGWPWGDGINYRCDRTRSVREPELCVPTVEMLSLGSVSHLRFQFVIPWKGGGGLRSRLEVEKKGRWGLISSMYALLQAFHRD